jgi:hypothetical protein
MFRTHFTKVTRELTRLPLPPFMELKLLWDHDEYAFSFLMNQLADTHCFRFDKIFESYVSAYYSG